MSLSVLPSVSQARESSKADLPKNGRSGLSVARIDEVTCVEDSLQHFEQMVASSGRPFVRLHCTVPTWSPSSTHCTDLHDLHDLRSRSLLFVHDLLNALRSVGVQATYHLAPSDSDLVVIRALPTEKVASITGHMELFARARASPKGTILMEVAKTGPIIVMT